MWFDDTTTVSNEQLNDYIRLYIFNKKNQYVSSKLLELSSKIRYEGLNEDTITQLNNFTKVDTVRREYQDIYRYFRRYLQ